MEELVLIKIVRFFLENPYDEVYLRELAKKIRLSPFAVKKYADMLIKEALIKEERKANLRYFKANVNSLFFRHLKVSYSIRLLINSGLIDFLKENTPNLSSVTLFGSAAKGEDDKKSDVDIVVIGNSKYLSFGKIEEKIGNDINMHIFSWSEWNKKAKKDEPFYSEVISHGIPLYGELPLVKWK